MTTQRNITTLFIVVLIGALISGCVYGYLFYAIKSKNETIGGLTSATEANLKKAVLEDALVNIVKDTEVERKELENYFVANDSLADFIAMLESLAKDRALLFTVSSIAVEENKTATTTGVYPTLKLHLTTRGTWNTTMNFYAALQSLPYKTTLGSVQLTKEGEDVKTHISTWSGGLDFSVIARK